MVFNIKYDPASNVKFVKCVEKYPIIYKYLNVTKLQKDKEWEKVAEELNSTVLFCRDRWTNLIGCYKRYLRHKAEKIMKRPYYLAEHMDFVKPYVNFKIGGRVQNGADIQSDSDDRDDDLGITVEDINLANQSVKMEVCNDFPANPVCVLIDSSDDEETAFEPLPIASEGSVSSFKQQENVNEDSSEDSGEDNSEDNNEDNSEDSNEDNNESKCVVVNVDDDDEDDDDNADLNFFKSLLPDIRLMTSQQQLKFRKELLNAIDMTLYGKELENIILKTEVE